MKWAMPRLTIRRLMLLVAGLAVIFGFASWMIRMTIRSNHFDRRAARHAHAYLLHREYVITYPAVVEDLKKGGVAPENVPKVTGGIGRDLRLRDYHAAMKAKYVRLARYPWLSVEPDPPEPE
jgi:hypothetical protein